MPCVGAVGSDCALVVAVARVAVRFFGPAAGVTEVGASGRATGALSGVGCITL